MKGSEYLKIDIYSSYEHSLAIMTFIECYESRVEFASATYRPAPLQEASLSLLSTIPSCTIISAGYVLAMWGVLSLLCAGRLFGREFTVWFSTPVFSLCTIIWFVGINSLAWDVSTLQEDGHPVVRFF